MANEAKIERDIIDWYCRNGWTAWHMQPDGIWIPKGWPDMLALGPNGVVKILEVKDPSDPNPDPIQLHFHKLLGNLGHPVAVVTSLEEAIADLEDR